MADPTADQLRDRASVPHEERHAHRRVVGVRAVVGMAGVVQQRHVAGGDVEVDRQALLLRGGPHRVPVPIGELWPSERARVLREHDALVAGRRAALDLAQRLVEVPERQRGHGQEALGVSLAELGLVVVVRADHPQLELLVGDLADRAGVEHRHVGVQHLGVDAVVVHPAQPRRSASQVAGSASVQCRGWSGGYSAQPACAAAPAEVTRWPPMNHASSWCWSSQRTWGTNSPQRLDMRDVHRSGGSTRWVSVSMTAISSTMELTGDPLVVVGHAVAGPLPSSAEAARTSSDWHR